MNSHNSVSSDDLSLMLMTIYKKKREETPRKYELNFLEWNYLLVGILTESRRVKHHREHDPVHVLLPDNSLDSLVTRDKESFVDMLIDKLPVVSSRHQHVSELGHPLVPLPRIRADPLDPQCQTVRNVVCAMGRMTGAGEQVLAAICFLPIQIRVYAAITNTERGVQEGDGVLGGAGARRGRR